MSHLQYQFPLASNLIVERMGQSRGLKYALPATTPIPAIADGYIVYTQNKTSKGNIAIVSHDDGYFTLYGGIAPLKPAQLGSPIARNHKIGVADDVFYLMIIDAKMGWVNGAAYNPSQFIKGRLSPSTRSGLHGFTIVTPSAEVWNMVKNKLKSKGLITALTDDRDARRAIQMLVSNHTAPILFDGVMGRYTAIGMQRFLKARGYEIEVDGHFDEKSWEIFQDCV